MKKFSKPFAALMSLVMLLGVGLTVPVSAQVVSSGTVSMDFTARARNNFTGWDDFIANPAAIPAGTCSGHLAAGGALSTLRGLYAHGIDFTIEGNRIVNSDEGFVRPNGYDSQFVSTVYIQGPFTINIDLAPQNTGPTNAQLAGVLLPQGQAWEAMHEDYFFGGNFLDFHFHLQGVEREITSHTFAYSGTGIYALVLGVARGPGGDAPNYERDRTRWHGIEVVFGNVDMSIAVDTAAANRVVEAVPEPTPTPAPQAGGTQEPPETGDTVTVMLAVGTAVLLGGLASVLVIKKRAA